jgi:hypothetical protein
MRHGLAFLVVFLNSLLADYRLPRNAQKRTKKKRGGARSRHVGGSAGTEQTTGGPSAVGSFLFLGGGRPLAPRRWGQGQGQGGGGGVVCLRVLSASAE